MAVRGPRQREVEVFCDTPVVNRRELGAVAVAHRDFRVVFVAAEGELCHPRHLQAQSNAMTASRLADAVNVDFRAICLYSLRPAACNPTERGVNPPQWLAPPVRR